MQCRLFFTLVPLQNLLSALGQKSGWCSGKKVKWSAIAHCRCATQVSKVGLSTMALWKKFFVCCTPKVCLVGVILHAESSFYHTSAGKSTFRTQNDTDSANFRYTAKKIVYFVSSAERPFRNLYEIYYFLLAGHKVHLIAPCGANKSIFRPPVGKKSCARREKYLFY